MVKDGTKTTFAGSDAWQTWDEFVNANLSAIEQRFAHKAGRILTRILQEVFNIKKGRKIKILTNYELKRHSTVPAQLVQGYLEAARTLGLKPEILAVPTAGSTDSAPEAVYPWFKKAGRDDLYVSSLIKLGTIDPERIPLALDRFLRKRKAKIIQHLHLGTVPTDKFREYLTMLDINYEKLIRKGREYKEKLSGASMLKLVSGPEDQYVLTFKTKLREIKEYTGDFKKSGQGGKMPTGEINTEALNLEKVSGRIAIHVYPVRGRATILTRPVILTVAEGRVAEVKGEKADDFKENIFGRIIEKNGGSHPLHNLVREVGIGLNPAINFDFRNITILEKAKYGPTGRKAFHISIGPSNHHTLSDTGYRNEKVTGQGHYDCISWGKIIIK